MRDSPNPKYRKLAQSYRKASFGLRSVNCFMADIIDEMISLRATASFKFKYKEAIALIRILEETGYAITLNSVGSIASDPNIFWDLIDAAKTTPLEADRLWHFGVCGVVALYHHFRNKNYFDSQFVNHDKTVCHVINRAWFRLFLLERYKTREDFYVFHQGKGQKNWATAYMEYESRYLKERIKTILEHHRHSMGDNYRIIIDVLEHFEKLFDNPREIKDYRDFSVERLDLAINRIRQRFPGPATERECTKWMRALFFLWSDEILAHPDHNFFQGSFVYTPELVLCRDTPNMLGKRYELVAAGLSQGLPPLMRVIFVVKRARFRVVPGRRSSVRFIDFSCFTDRSWRKIFVNYVDSCIASERNTFKSVRKFALWMMERKRGTADPYQISSNDLNEYRVTLFLSKMGVASKNAIINAIKDFIRWAVKNESLKADPKSLRRFRGFKNTYRPDPNALSWDILNKIDKAFLELAELKNDDRFLLSRALSRSLLHTERRCYEMCGLRTGDIRFHKDGSSTISIFSKNGGSGRVFRDLGIEATNWLRMAMNISRDTRASCPVGGPKDSVFLYQSTFSMVPYTVLNTQRFDGDLAIACEYAHIKKVTSGNYRDTYQTAVKKMSRKQKFTELQERSLTGHAVRLSTNSYDDIDLRDILLEARNIKIGK